MAPPHDNLLATSIYRGDTFTMFKICLKRTELERRKRREKAL